MRSRSYEIPNQSPVDTKGSSEFLRHSSGKKADRDVVPPFLLVHNACMKLWSVVMLLLFAASCKFPDGDHRYQGSLTVVNNSPLDASVSGVDPDGYGRVPFGQSGNFHYNTDDFLQVTAGRFSRVIHQPQGSYIVYVTNLP